MLKQGCSVERLQLSAAARLSNATALYSRVAARLLRLTYLARLDPDRPASTEFTADEVTVPKGSRRAGAGAGAGAVAPTLSWAINAIARLGGHLGRKGADPPGLKTLWRGLLSLRDRVEGDRLARDSLGRNVRNV